MSQGIYHQSLFHESKTVVHDFFPANNPCVVDKNVNWSKGIICEGFGVLNLFKVGTIAFHCYALTTLLIDLLSYCQVKMEVENTYLYFLKLFR